MIKQTSQPLPAESVVGPLLQALKNDNVIVGAPPGAGKSTVLPLALLPNYRGRLIMLQPRRVVVRSLASYLAALLGETVGETVGYRIRGEQRVGKNTRLEIVTEGVLSRLIQSDPELRGIELLIFDEFHERNIHSDFGLALALEVQEGLREDLRVLVMSATLDVDELKCLMPSASVLTTHGQRFDVTEHYLGQIKPEQLHQRTAQQTLTALNEHEGDILVFLPGVGAINKVGALLSQQLNSTQVALHYLYGALDKAEQDAAIKTDPEHRRKIILATNIAETSLTIEGIRVVIDSGLENVASFHPGAEITQLNTQMISQASATQRKGRAGRTGPGTVYRLWPKEQQDRLAPFPLPQIQREDVMPLMLDAMNWGSTLSDMALLSQPTSAQLSAAQKGLKQINAVDAQGSITAYGRRLADFPCHPQLAHMMLSAFKAGDQLDIPGLPAVACYVAAVAQEGRLATSCLRLSDAFSGLNTTTKNRLKKQAERFGQYIKIPIPSLNQIDNEGIGVCLALAYPQKVAKRKASGDYKLAGGRGAKVAGDKRENTDWLVMLQGQQIGSEVLIHLAEPVSETALRLLYPDDFSARVQVSFSPQRRQMEARKTTGFHKIVLSSEPSNVPGPDQLSSAWLEMLTNLTPPEWPFSDADRQWWNRLCLATDMNLPQPQSFDTTPKWPRVSSFTEIIEKEQLIRVLGSARQWEQLKNIPWQKLCHQSLPWSQQHALDTLLPVSIKVPTGNQKALSYGADGTVILAVRMQEMYGCNEVITLAGGLKRVAVQLLSPAGRPIQTTADLAAFWTGSYREIQKEMKGRYPKHFWPDEPATANATTRTKKHM